MINSATLSVCMIVKNEESLLGRCLQSIKDVSDEIIIVDTGSTDKTIEIAKSFGATVIEEMWRNDFAFVRNISLQNATSTWIIWLDADDVVPGCSLPEIACLKASNPDRVYGFVIRNERPGDTGTEFVQARMFPNDPRIRFERRIHEQMMPCALRAGFTLEKTGIVIEHHGYAQPDVLKKKAKRNLDLLLEDYKSYGSDTVTAIEIADSYQLIEDYDNASLWYRQALEIPKCRQETPALAGQALLGLGVIENRRECYNESIKFLNDALILSPWRPDVHYSLSVAFELSGDTGMAINHLRKLLDVKEQPGQVGVDFRASKIKGYLRLIRLFTEQNNLTDAFSVIAQALELFPSRPELHMMSGKVLLKAGKLIDALHAFEKSILLVREFNLDSYIGLCIIYRLAGVEQKVNETLDAMIPMFGGMRKYQVFRKYFLTLQKEDFSDKENEAYEIFEQIRQEYFFVI